MSEPIDRLCDQLRIKLHGIDRRLEALKANGSDMSDKSRHQLESQIDSVQQRIFDRRRAVETANARVTAWVERKRPAFDRNVAEWRKHRSFSTSISGRMMPRPTRLLPSSLRWPQRTKLLRRHWRLSSHAATRRALPCRPTGYREVNRPLTKPGGTRTGDTTDT